MHIYYMHIYYAKSAIDNTHKTMLKFTTWMVIGFSPKPLPMLVDTSASM